ncbi:hypothetical protein FRC12_022738 [Ceratobasidium sp. 428]|nr:hypothetical protein FRC12_022738 [Ceratobasidium sp. 428]
MSTSSTHQAYDGETTTDSYENAFLNWKSAQDHLHRAFQGFIDASQSLNDARVERSRYQTNPQTRTTISNHIDDEILSLSSLQNYLDSAKATLLHSMSTSATLGPIHKLPAEILGYIFVLQQPCCVHRAIIQKPSEISKSQLIDTISMVCSNWRKVALNTRELWSHLDFATNVKHVLFNLLCDRARLWIERARGCSLHLHLHEFNRSGKADHKVIEGLLRPHLPHVVSIHMWSNSNKTPFEDFPWELLGSKLSGSNPVITEVSIEYESSKGGSIKLPSKYFSLKGGFYESVSVLHLRRAGIPWDNHICRGLTDLRLESLVIACPSLAQLAAILAASPGLSSLALGFGIGMILNFDGNPIPLNNLEVLNIQGVMSGWLSPILRLLAPGPLPLSMSVSPRVGDRKELNAFFERSNVTRLFVSGSLSAAWCPLPDSLRPSLQVLAIAYSQFLSNEEPNLISTYTSTSHELKICPKLRSLHIVASSVKPELLVPVVVAHPDLEALWLTDCSIRDYKRSSKPKGYAGPKNMNEVADLMPEAIQSITRVASNYGHDPVRYWDCIV